MWKIRTKLTFRLLVKLLVTTKAIIACIYVLTYFPTIFSFALIRYYNGYMQYKIPGELWRGLILSADSMNWYYQLIYLVIWINSSCAFYIHYPEIFTLKHNLYCFSGEDHYLQCNVILEFLYFFIENWSTLRNNNLCFKRLSLLYLFYLV